MTEERPAMNTPETKLRECPFCDGSGGVPMLASIRAGGLEWWYVECGDCNAQGPELGGPDEAIAAWNTRPTPDAAEREGLASKSGYNLASHVAGILAEWDMKPPPDETCGHDYDDIARDIVARTALRSPATPTPDARTDTGKLLAENEGLIAHAKAAAYGIKRVAELEAALRPFADYADPRNTVPAGLHITQGSYLVKRQLTMGDCYGARAALADTAKGEGHE